MTTPWLSGTGARSRSSIEGIVAALRHRVDGDIDGEFGIVVAQEAFVPPVVVPLAAVVLVAVQNRKTIAPLDALQVVMDDVVAPAVELVRRLRRTGKGEEAAIDR